MKELNTEEARLIAVYRAIERFGSELGVIRTQDCSLIWDYLNVVTDVTTLDEKPSEYIDAYLDGLIAGFAASRLANAGIDPDELAEPHGETQTGVDPVTGDVRQ